MARKETPTRRIGRWITEYGDPPFGYAVRIRRGGVSYNDYFAVRDYGTPRKAVNASKRYAQKVVRNLPEIQPQSTRDIKTRRNKSGKVGVHLWPSVNKKWPNSVNWAYVASWHRDGKHTHVSFALGKYGEEAAWEMACIARDNELRDRDRILRIFEQQKRRKGKQS